MLFKINLTLDPLPPFFNLNEKKIEMSEKFAHQKI